MSYPDNMKVRRVQMHGDIKYLGKHLFVTESLSGEYIGIEQTGENSSLLWYCGYLLGQIDHKQGRIVPTKSWPLISAVNCGDTLFSLCAFTPLHLCPLLVFTLFPIF